MPRAKKQVSNAVELSAADRRDFAEFLSASHDEMKLWRKCTRTRCQRERRCYGEIDECGGACAPKEWARVRRTVAGMRDGQSERAATRAAKAAEKPRILTIVYGRLGRFVFEVNDEGKWTLINSSRQGPDEMARSEWERLAPEGEG